MENKEQKADKSKVATPAEKIWEEIKDKRVDMFTLPNQLVSNYCTPTVVEPNKCYLTFQVSAILPALEAALGSNYKVESVGRFIAVSHITPTIG